MSKPELELVKVYTAAGQLEANVVKSRLESEGIPAMLRYDSASNIYGIYVDGLGQVDVLVPARAAEQAKEILSSQPGDTTEDAGPA